MPGDLRKPLISGNWKMNLNHYEAIHLVQKLSYLVGADDFEVVVGFARMHSLHPRQPEKGPGQIPSVGANGDR